MLTDEGDKARFGRTVPLSDVARNVLEKFCPEAGLIFGAHCFDKHLKHAAAMVLGPEVAKSFASYDFRHGRANHLVDRGAPLTGGCVPLGASAALDHGPLLARVTTCSGARSRLCRALLSFRTFAGPSSGRFRRGGYRTPRKSG